MKTVSLIMAGVAVQTPSISLLAQTDRPNIVLIMTDQQRADLCGREGFPLDVTPYVDELAKQNVWFNKAYTVMPASSPARCSMLTGRFPSATHVRTNHNIQDVYFETDLLAVLKNKGYKTALVGKNHSYLKPKDMDYWSGYGHWGKDKKETEAEQETARFLDQQARGQWLEPSPIPLEEQNPVKIVTDALTWVDKQAQEANPFFVWVSFPEPHNPYQVCEPYYSMFPPEKLPELKSSRKDLIKKSEKYRILAELEDKSCPDLENDLPRIRSNYTGMLRLIDDQIKRLIETFKEKGMYENTLFVVLADHGDYCGEYGLIRKGAGLSESLTRIPMVWAGYKILSREHPMNACVSIADLFPTLCTAIGADIPVGVQGRSLWPMLTGKSYPQKEFESIVVQLGYGGEDVGLDSSISFEQEGALTTGKVAVFDCLNTWTQSGMSRMIRKGDWKLIMDSYGTGELYNLKEDPSELNNLFGENRSVDIQTDLLVGLMAWELRLQDPLPLPSNRYHFKKNLLNYHIKYGSADTDNQELRIPKFVQPAFDYWMRDTWVTLGPDGYYYMTGTTAAPNRQFQGMVHCWDWNDGLYLWRSADLKTWKAKGLIWSMEKDATWQKSPKVYKEGEKYAMRSINGDLLDNCFRAVWAPEIHYIKSAKNWFIVACMNQSVGGKGSFILRSMTGKPEGPYENIEGNKDRAIFPNIDGSLFEDTDGTVYFVGHNHYIARMKPDMSGLAEEPRTLKETNYNPEPYIEGAFIFKHAGKYHLVQAIWSHRTKKGDTYVEEEGVTSQDTRYSYDCIIACADNVYGPYTERYNAITGGGHNNFFQDKKGHWWATLFFNPRGGQAAEYEVTCRPGLIPMIYENGKFKPNHNKQK